MPHDPLTREGEKSREGKKEAEGTGRERGRENDSLKVTSHFAAANIRARFLERASLSRHGTRYCGIFRGDGKGVEEGSGGRREKVEGRRQSRRG